MTSTLSTSSKVISGVFAGIGAVVGFLYGNANVTLVYTLWAFMAVDYICGSIKAAKKGKLSSRVGFIGITKKLLILVILALVHLLETTVLKTNNILMISGLFYYIANEGLSILENVSDFIPVPKKIRDILSQLRDENDE